MLLTSLAPTPVFTRIAEASRARVTTVTDGGALPGALATAVAHIDERRRHALIEVRIRP
jgi:acetolactate synthase-1/2/3 large subunit